jgi:hypothetical protein
MVRLGCASEEQTLCETLECALLFEMWKYLAEDEELKKGDFDKLNTDSLKLFLMVILRVADGKMLQEYLCASHHGFNFEDAQSHVKKFEPFYLNRIKTQA